MTSTRKRQKELKRLRKDAESVWQDQQQVWDRANLIAREAGRQASDYARNDVAPAVRKGYKDHVQPRIDRTVEYGQELKKGGAKAYAQAQPKVEGAVKDARSNAHDLKKNAQGLTHDVAKDPRVKKALKTAKGLANDPRVKDAVKQAKKAGAKASKKVDKATGKSSGPGAGAIIGLVVGGVALIGIGYAVWQTFRADDELWVSDDDAGSTTAS